MKKAWLLIIMMIILLLPTAVYAENYNTNPDFSMMFDKHGSIMLIIDPESGAILYANDAAASFYGYTKEQLLAMKIC